MVGAVSVVLAAVALLAGASAQASAAAAPYCGIRWGSLLEQDPTFTIGSITGVRAGRHACFDRLVVDLSGPVTGYRAEYVAEVTRDGSGFPVPLRGGAFIQFVVHGPAYDASTGTPTYTPDNPAELVNTRNFRTLRQVTDGGSFEGQTTFGVGVRGRLPFRVFVLAGPGSGSRVVIDIAHRW